MNGKLYLPPLFHALYQRFWGLALFLLKYDTASLTEKTSPHTTVLDVTMSLGVIHPDMIHFLFGFCTSDLRTDELPRGGRFVPPKFRDAGGYHVFRLVHDCITGGNVPHLDFNFDSPLAQVVTLYEHDESEDTLRTLGKTSKPYGTAS